jgi:hypothetical protein
VVETKAAGLSLTDDDRDQAISYARLVHPIAPYALVTNGNDYRLYHTVTKEPTNPSDIQIRGFDATLSEEDIARAQALFLGLNRNNLSTFCQQQVTAEQRVIKGTLDQDRKYVPELHVAREHVVRDVEQLYRSPLPGLLIVGDYGSWKTCELCWIADRLLERG